MDIAKYNIFETFFNLTIKHCVRLFCYLQFFFLFIKLIILIWDAVFFLFCFVFYIFFLKNALHSYILT